MGIARNLARLVPNGSGELPTANLQNSAVTKAKQAADAYTVIKTRQYVFNTYSTVATSAGSWVDLGIYGDITPAYSNSIIKIEFVMPLSFSGGNNSSMRVVRRIGGGSFTLPATTTATAISNRMQGHSLSFWGFGDNWSNNLNHIMTFYDNPATTSQVTYRAEFGCNQSLNIRIGYNFDTSSGSFEYAVAPQIVILTELAAGVVETVDAV
jgi:hypothetical protein